MFLAIVCCLQITMVLSLSANNFHSNSYGLYVPRWYNLEKCSGPKSRNTSTFSTAFRSDHDVYRMDLNLTTLMDSKIESVRILVSPLSGNKASQWKYKIDQPCKHPVLAISLMQFTDLQKCSISKGQHRIQINLTDLTLKFFGAKFFYGEYLFKCLLLAQKGNILCMKFTMKVEKRIEL